MPTPPQRTPEQRIEALSLALEARKKRAAVKNQVTFGTTRVEQVLEEGAYGTTDELGEHARVSGRIEIGDLLLAVRGVGPSHAATILTEAGVEDASEHLDKLNADQRQAIVRALVERGLQK